jgi:hypothetical protein
MGFGAQESSIGEVATSLSTERCQPGLWPRVCAVPRKPGEQDR